MFVGIWFWWLGIVHLTHRLPSRMQWVLRLLLSVSGLVGVGYLLYLSNTELSTLEEPLTWNFDWREALGLTCLSIVFWLWSGFSTGRQWAQTALLRFGTALLFMSALLILAVGQGFDYTRYWGVLLQYIWLVWFGLDSVWVLWCFGSWDRAKHLQSPLSGVLFSSWNPIQSFFDALEGVFGIDIQGTWVIRFVRQILEPLTFLLLLLGWLSTSLVQVHPSEQGIRSHFGVPESVVLEGGLHWKLPYPFGQMIRVQSTRIHQLSIGHAEELVELDTEQEAPESILWANQHGDEEFLLLLGDGHDVISADGVLEYRIVNVHQYVFASQNPEEVLESVVYQVLMEQTSSRTLEEALSENLSVLAEVVTKEIQERLVPYEIGIEPLLFTFTALHPPVAVAKEYQDVVSAQIDQQTTVLRAEQYQLSSIPKTRAKAHQEIEKAKQKGMVELAQASGDALSFEALRQTVRSQESLYRFRRRQENLQQSIAGRNLVILDHRLESQGATLWINP